MVRRAAFAIVLAASVPLQGCTIVGLAVGGGITRHTDVRVSGGQVQRPRDLPSDSEVEVVVRTRAGEQAIEGRVDQLVGGNLTLEVCDPDGSYRSRTIDVERVQTISRVDGTYVVPGGLIGLTLDTIVVVMVATSAFWQSGSWVTLR